MSERTSLKMNESDGFTNLNQIVQKINSMEDRLDYLNDSIQEMKNSSAEHVLILNTRDGNLEEEIDILRRNVSAVDRSVQLDANERKSLRNVHEQRFSNITNAMKNTQNQMISNQLEATERKNVHEERFSNITNAMDSIQNKIRSVQLEANERKSLVNLHEQRFLNITNAVVRISNQMESVQLEANESKSLLNVYGLRFLNITNSMESVQNQMNSLQIKGNERKSLINVHEQRFSTIINTMNNLQNRINSMVRVRLVGGSTAREGRVEVYHSNVWGTICDDKWGSSDARVVCRMLGYSGSYTAYDGAHYGQGTGQIWLENVECSGSESTIFSCRHGSWGAHDCSHGEDASVKCT
ncbi:macrophage scavenger receptor types I and II-like [Saccostrea cucullata]|uniref:macrophage scavenger receptor types I and II-like n=1 Tax=Saccostrea cuccullata TaxID=36930 RepID=UPI002ED68D7C